MLHRVFTLALGLGLALSVGVKAADSPAANRPMLDVTSSYPDGYKGRITVDFSDADVVTGFHFTDTQGTTLDYSVDDMRRGVVLLHALGKNIIRMVSPQFDPQAGGVVHLVFLRNFFGSDYRQADVDFVRGISWDVWTDDVQGKDAFDRIHVVIQSSFGVPSSVGRIQFKHQDQIVRDLNPSDLPTAPPGLLQWLGLMLAL
jgi:hypothetical protein